MSFSKSGFFSWIYSPTAKDSTCKMSLIFANISAKLRPKSKLFHGVNLRAYGVPFYEKNRSGKSRATVYLILNIFYYVICNWISWFPEIFFSDGQLCQHLISWVHLKMVSESIVLSKCKYNAKLFDVVWRFFCCSPSMTTMFQY